MENFRRILRKNIGLYLGLLLFFSLGFQKDGWHIRKSFHFIVYYKNCNPDFLDKLIDKAEDAYTQITQQLNFFRDQPWVWENRAKIYVFDNKNEYIKNTQMPPWSGGCARPFQRTVYTYSESYKFFKYTLVHELTHLVFREFIKKRKVPLWLDEGVAVYMERKNEASPLVRTVKMLLKKGLYLPFDQFLSLEFTDLDKERNPQENLEGLNYVEKFYLQSFSLVYFLIDKYGSYRFTQLLRNIRDGDNFKEAFFKTYRIFGNFKGLEKEWKEFYQEE